jgi:hypothetical protein
MAPPSVPFWLLLAAVLGVGCAQSATSPVRLNEILPSNSDGCADDIGERNDWVELYNTGDAAVDLAGDSLTDDTASPRKSVIPEGFTIEAKSTSPVFFEAYSDISCARVPDGTGGWVRCKNPTCGADNRSACGS